MANRENLIEYVRQLIPQEQLQPLIDEAEMELSQDPDVTPEAVEELIKQLEFVAENPEAYKDVVTSAIQSGLVDPEDVPPEFDPVFVAIMLLACYELTGRIQGQQQFAKGGLAQAAKKLQAKGRGGDTILAHINPKEAEVLRRMGGSGTVNPNTGLLEFKGGIGKVFKSVGKAIGKVVKSVAKVAKAALPIAVQFIPGIGPVGAAALGAAAGALSGGGLRGAVLGGLGGYLGAGGSGLANTIGKSVTDFLPTSIGSTLAQTIGTEALGSSILGGASSALMGKNPLVGALTAGATNYLSPKITEMLSGTPVANLAGGITQGANIAAQTGSDPIVGGLTGGLSQVGGNLLTGQDWNAPLPSPAQQQTAQNVNEGTVYNPDYYNPQGQLAMPGTLEASGMVQDPTTGTYYPADSAAGRAVLQTKNTQGMMTPGTPEVPKEAEKPGLLSTSNVLTGLSALNALGGLTVPQAQQVVQQETALTEAQKEALNRELTNYSANWNATTLPQAGTPEYDDLMNRIYQGIGMIHVQPTLTQQPMKQGGLSTVAMLARGTGHGRSDTIDARLSDGEYVIDAETVALLGNGSTKAGAAALDMMREQIRRQKGKVLAKGKFSPDAKSPLAYIKGGLK